MCIVESLSTLFCPENVLDIKDGMVAILAAEDKESSVERARCCEKLKVPENGLREFKIVQEHLSHHHRGHPIYKRFALEHQSGNVILSRGAALEGDTAADDSKHGGALC